MCDFVMRMQMMVLIYLCDHMSTSLRFHLDLYSFLCMTFDSVQTLCSPLVASAAYCQGEPKLAYIQLYQSIEWYFLVSISTLAHTETQQSFFSISGFLCGVLSCL